MLYFKVNQNNINDNNFWMSIAHKIMKTVSSQQILTDKLIVIKLQDITSDDSTMIPKIEFKSSC